MIHILMIGFMGILLIKTMPNKTAKKIVLVLCCLGMGYVFLKSAGVV